MFKKDEAEMEKEKIERIRRRREKIF